MGVEGETTYLRPRVGPGYRSENRDQGLVHFRQRIFVPLETLLELQERLLAGLEAIQQERDQERRLFGSSILNIASQRSQRLANALEVLGAVQIDLGQVVEQPFGGHCKCVCSRCAVVLANRHE